ncbi:MAG: universal stress protein [Pseudaminobacter sp.]
MIYNTIMVHLDIDLPATPRLAFAWDIANRFDADLIAFSAADPHLVASGDLDGSAAVEAVRQQVEQIEERLRDLKSEFDSFAQDNNKMSWRETVGDPTRHLAVHARAADLVITGPGNDKSPSRLRTIDPGDLILSAGRPILFANEDYRPMTAENILVAWKDTREARRAVVDAMPFLTGARRVLVAATEEDDRTLARSSAADMVRFLMKHGVKAHSNISDLGRADTTETLLELAVEFGADLTVSGGYGHSRLREWIFGGVTRGLLKDGSINRLISN